MRIVVAGVAGSGKTTVGVALAEQLSARFVDGDSLHSAGNVDKMAAGIPLTDADRWPWLDAIIEALDAEHDIVVACSALKRTHRDRLRQVIDVQIVFLDLDQSEAEARAAARVDHFMGAEMAVSQFATLERPTSDETDTFLIDASLGVAAVVATACRALIARDR